MKQKKNRHLQEKNRRYQNDFKLPGQIAAILVVYLLLFLLLTSVSYSSIRQKNKEALEKLTMQSLTQQTENVDRYTKHLATQSYEFLRSSVVLDNMPPIGDYSIEDYLTLPSVIQTMKTYAVAGLEFENETFFYCNDKHIFTRAGLNDFDIYFNSLRQRKNGDSTFWKEVLLWKDGWYTLNPDMVTYKEKNTQDSVIPLIRVRREGNRTTVLVTDLSAKKINNYFLENLIIEGQTLLILDGQGNTFLNTTGNIYTDKELEALEHKALPLAALYEQEKHVSNSDACTLTSMKGENGLSYFVYTPKVNLKYRAEGMNSPAILLFYVMTAIFLLFLTLLYVRRLYSPLKEMLRNLKAVQEEPPKTSVDKERFLGYSKSYLALVLATGSKVGSERFQEQIFSSTSLVKKGFYSLLVRFSFSERFWKDFTVSQQNIIMSNLPLILRGTLRAGRNLEIIEYDSGEYVCFFNLEPQEKEDMFFALQNLKKVFQYEKEYCRIMVGVSAAGENKLVLDTLMEAATAQQYPNGDKSFSAVWYENLAYNTRPDITSVDISRLENQMRSGDKEQMLETAKALFNRNHAKALRHENLGLLTGRLYSLGLDYLLSLTDPLGTPPRLASSSEIAGQSIPLSQEETLTFLSYCLQETLEQPLTDVGILEEIIEYMETYYTRDIYLHLLAEEFDLNPKYLSRLFKDTVGIGVPEYVNQLRIHRAKELLLTTADNVDQIGEKVGYTNRTTFFRTFKKLEGTSPARFRRDNQHVS